MIQITDTAGLIVNADGTFTLVPTANGGGNDTFTAAEVRHVLDHDPQSAEADIFRTAIEQGHMTLPAEAA